MNSRKGSQLIFEQLFDLINQLDNMEYARELKVLNAASIGKHCRHILDFYKCLIKGVNGGVVDYCKRERSENVETDVQSARAAFMELQAQINALDEAKTLDIYTEFHIPNDVKRPIVTSTVGRELMFAYDHAVHHMAIIKIGIQNSFEEVRIDQNMGIASSTMKHQKIAELA